MPFPFVCRHVAFLASFQHPVAIFEQLSIIYQLPRMFVGSFTLVLPYFPTGTAERVSSCSYPSSATLSMLMPYCVAHCIVHAVFLIHSGRPQ